VCAEPHYLDNNKETLNMKKHMKGNMFSIIPVSFPQDYGLPNIALV
jgi:hypothetical protein